MSLITDAQRIFNEYEALAVAGTMDRRQAIVHRTGLGWGRYLEAHKYMVDNLLIPGNLAIRYDQRQRLWTAGAERYNGVAGYDESKDFVAWHGKYLRTRILTSDTHLEAISQAFPSKRRSLRPGALHRYLQNAVAELDDAMSAL